MMLLNGLRRKSDVYDRSQTNVSKILVSPPDSTSADGAVGASAAGQQESPRPRPASAASTRRPSSSHVPSTQPPRLSARPSSPYSAANQLQVPRLGGKSRYASDPQINASYKKRSSGPPTPDSDGAPAPVIGITAPTKNLEDGEEDGMMKKRLRSFGQTMTFRSRSYNNATTNGSTSHAFNASELNTPDAQEKKKDMNRPSTSSLRYGRGNVDADSEEAEQNAPRLSEAGSNPRSSGASTPASVTKRPRAESRSRSLFRISRRKKQPEPLFPLPPKVTRTPQSPNRLTPANSPSPGPEQTPLSTSDALSPQAALVSPLARQPSNASAGSAHSTPAETNGYSQANRSRASTTRSFPGKSDGGRTSISHQDQSGRTSTASTTLGRNSMAGLRSLTSKLRNSSDPHTPRFGSPAPGLSQNNSFAESHDTLVVPEREEGETAGRYYARLEQNLPKKHIAAALSKSSSPFEHDVLRSLMRTFKFYEEPMDISLRKFLWEIDLPAESQQIDRVVESFAERYHECNPHIFDSQDMAFLLAYSLIILHSDLFNPSNKNKMQRHQYQKNTGGNGIPDEILGYFYDNIQYTEFIAQEADEDTEKVSRAQKMAMRKGRKLKSKTAPSEAAKSGKLDPYEVIIDDKLDLDVLRPSLKGELNLENTYSYLGTANRFDIQSLSAAFNKYGIIELLSARSRPEAFTSDATTANPEDAPRGKIPIKVAKVGVVWRKTGKRKKTKSPWQEWGIVLTQSQIYFFRNYSFVKNLMHQIESHNRQGNRGMPCVFKPPLESMDAQERLATSDAVALVDASYKRHKNAFILARRGFPAESVPGARYFEETLLADDEREMNDWVAKLNYASTFRSANVRIQPWHMSSARPNSNETSRSAPAANEADDSAEIRPSHEVEPASALLSDSPELQANLAQKKLSDCEVEVTKELKKLEDLLRNARHLEILAPFMPKTRSDMLAFGARLSHNIKWSRYDLARLKCQRELLIKTLEQTPSALSSGIVPGVVDGPARTTATIKAVPSAETGEKTLPIEVSRIRTSMHSYRNSDIIDSMDEAFATPSETISRTNPTYEGLYKLLPLDLQSAQIHGGGMSDHDVHELPVAGDMMGRRPSTASSSSQPSRAEAESEHSRSGTPTNAVRESGHDAARPDTSEQSDKEALSRYSSPSSRQAKRRSLHRTLRDGRDVHGSQSSRSGAHRRKGGDKDVTLTTSAEDGSASQQDNEGLSRKGGSFTVHGKKASVITLGSEWQQISPEERLRLRKLAQRNGQYRNSTAMSKNSRDDDDRRGSVLSESDLISSATDTAPEPDDTVSEMDDDVDTKPKRKAQPKMDLKEFLTAFDGPGPSGKA